MIDAYIFEAGWMFFLAWSVLVAIAVILAFGRDMFPSNSRAKSQPTATSDRSVHPLMH
jgi:hypothetical protein